MSTRKQVTRQSDRQSSAWFIEHIPSPIGTIVMLTDSAERVRALDWEDHLPRLERMVQRQLARVGSTSDVAVEHYAPRATASGARLALESYFDGNIAAIDDIAVEGGGTVFQQAVWAALRRIPAGETTSYQALASTIARPRAVRAVGLANGSNPISIIVPCHRVIGANGALTGYGGGLPRKEWLLAHEAKSDRVSRTRL